MTHARTEAATRARRLIAAYEVAAQFVGALPNHWGNRGVPVWRQCTTPVNQVAWMVFRLSLCVQHALRSMRLVPFPSVLDGTLTLRRFRLTPTTSPLSACLSSIEGKWS